MHRRHAFRSTALERLEDRVLLSHAPAAIVRAEAATPRTKPLKIGALGDSYTDEYRFYAPDRITARNWVEILATDRRLQFGSFSRMKRAIPRDAGFAYNWARSDATSDDMVRNQLPGLSDQVRKGQVNTAWIFIGGNDFFHYAQGLSLQNLPGPAQLASGLAKVESRAADNLTTAVRTLLSANPNVNLVLVTLPDVRNLPALASIQNLPQARPILDAVSASIGRYNARIRELAASEPGRVAVADLNAQFSALLQQGAPSGTLTIGKTAIDLKTPSDDYRHFFLADGVHIGTVAQALLANLFIQTMNSSFNAGIKPLTPAEIIRVGRTPPLR
ncbi:MAG: phospholipase/lecithinase/hemolysin [Planctomycetota bacterium]|nr:phospholipase/lecithinase/hemolysin [Planctomycetota bacterium]